MPTIAIATLACMAGAFLICGVPSGLIIARHSSEHVDVRKVGSGNIGMTNVARSAGGGAAALTLDPAQWQRIGNISRACDYLELSGRADFAAAFTDDLSFPQP